MTHQQIGTAYCQAGHAGSTPLELVVLLYDALLDDLRRAIRSIRSHDIESRTAELQHAHRILEQLQGNINFELGADAARNLDKLYSLVRAKLLEAQWKSSDEILQSQIELLRPVRDAWNQASVETPPAPSPAPFGQPVECHT